MKLLLYCTKAKPYLNCDFGKDNHEEYSGNWNIYLADKQDECSNIVNGKIVAECDFEVEEIKYDWYPCNIVPKWEHYYTYYRTNKIEPKEFYEKSCLNWEQLNSYLNDYDSQSFEGGYAIHIKNLHIFDKPRELSEYYNKNVENITRAPQNMMLCHNVSEEIKTLLGKTTRTLKVNEYVLISIQPQYLCKILNGEKIIEVRKNVLKEILKDD